MSHVSKNAIAGSSTTPSELDLSKLKDSPLQPLQSPFLKQAGIRLFIKRDDLIHPQFGGNKWRKLKYNLIYARQQQFETLLTFGGAWSNHIYATAAAARYYDFNSIGIIRGEKHTPLNTTLAFAEQCGMQLHYLNRADYRQKHEAHYLQELKQKFGNIYILPEGGSNLLALKGCAEIVPEIDDAFSDRFGTGSANRPDVICCACGTGATLAGLVSASRLTAVKKTQQLIGFSALKGGEFLNDEVKTFLNKNNPDTDKPDTDWHIETDFHFGGYAKVDDTLIHFIKDFQAQYDIALDAVYTGKMFYGLFKRIEAGTFPPGTTIVAIHSGGLQGNTGFKL